MNKLFIIGNLTANPVLRTTPQGLDVCSFSVAVNRRADDHADYFNVTAWRSLGVSCSKYLAKGRTVAVIGEVRARAYNDKAGAAHAVMELSADEIKFLGGRQADDGGAASKDPGGWSEVSDADLPFSMDDN